jgi:hypothetical protein
MLNVEPCRFPGVMLSVLVVASRRVSVMGGFFVLAALMMPCSLHVVPCGVFVMFRSLTMVIRSLFGHCASWQAICHPRYPPRC